ncbi:hypothetical protein BCR24_01610 [Enterococcus ureilyticus]|uniref:Tandem five-TM protein n=1 Tax=Enterococcus ureilyticus TaxID=1131292 RepID=A0A1E5HGU9_9ENTE|nr:DUF443 family protein [Enterococcus ureilyticus]MBM7689643.1 putative membrane protein (TIGR01218 family) [Enterococcus ureilyticus]OEG24076.1 hypothetical protein BCR24_01610 [Enterococcus ureilyticus]
MKIYESTNKRYKLVELNEKCYLLDVDSKKISWFLPMFVWLLPFKAIEIDKGVFEKLLTNKKAGYGVVQIVFLSILIGRPSTWLINMIFQNITISEIKMRALYLIAVSILLICYRAVISVYNKHKMKNELGEKRQEIVISIEKESITSYYKRNSLVALLIVFLAIFVVGYISVFYSFDMIVIFIICVLFSLFLNRGYVYPYGSSFCMNPNKK